MVVYVYSVYMFGFLLLFCFVFEPVLCTRGDVNEHAVAATTQRPHPVRQN